MNDLTSRSARLHIVVALGAVTMAAVALLAMGRTFFCRCDAVKLWYGNTSGPENSQQLADPYSFTHITHGVLLYAMLVPLAGRWSLAARGALAIALESAWEVFENTDFVINRYRAATMALGYYGDSVFNSLGDIAFCAIGVLLAARLTVPVTIALVVGLEAALTLWIRDSLLLNMVMLIRPIEAIKRWQLAR